MPNYDIEKRKLHVNFIDNFMKSPTTIHVIQSLVSIEITNSTFVEELNIIISTELKINSNNIFYFSKKKFISINISDYDLSHAFELIFYFLVIFKVIEIYNRFYTIKKVRVVIYVYFFIQFFFALAAECSGILLYF